MAVQFEPGQWLDVVFRDIKKPGGFTITSAPSLADSALTPEPYVELAIQRSAENPAAERLWQPINEILNQELSVRVGGSFTWPPLEHDGVENVVFVAGGVGIKYVGLTRQRQ